MTEYLYNKLRAINLWHFLWISVLLAELFTFLTSALVSYLLWGRLSGEVLLVGIVDSFVVCLLVVGIIIYFVNRIHEVQHLNSQLEEEVVRRRNVEQELKLLQEDLEKRVARRTVDLARTNKSLQEEIAQRIQLEKELQESESRYRAVVEDQTELVCRFRSDGTLTFVNDAYCRYFRKERADLIHSIFMPKVFEDDRHLVEECIRSLGVQNSVATVEHRVVGPDNEIRWQQWVNRAIFDEHANIIEYQAVGRDITQQKKMEKELMQAQKMEAVGVLASGIAHDFNNILNSIFGYLETAKRLYADDSAREICHGIETSAKRSASLVRQVLTFTRPESAVEIPLHLQEGIKEVLDIVKGSIPATIRIEKNIDRQCGMIMANENNIHQILMNLITNACNAMGEGGLLEIALKQVAVGEGPPPPLIDLSSGQYACLTVKDSGKGMDAETRERIFEPYFTTKLRGEGTGLGLSTVHGIVKSSKGAITVDSSPGEGTAVHVFLPLYNQEPWNEEAVGKELFEKTVNGTGRILYVDDEEASTVVWKIALEQAGFEVAAFTSAAKALAAFRSDPSRFDIVVTDHLMPEMKGTELAAMLIAVRKEIPIILTTGWQEEIDADPSLFGIREIISKPHEAGKLVGAINRIMAV